jgi:hypothetical protein
MSWRGLIPKENLRRREMTTQELEAQRTRYRNLGKWRKPRTAKTEPRREPKTWAQMFLNLAVIFVIPLVLCLVAALVLLYLQSPRVGEEMAWVRPALDLVEVLLQVLIVTCVVMKVFYQLAKMIE